MTEEENQNRLNTVHGAAQYLINRGEEMNRMYNGSGLPQDILARAQRIERMRAQVNAGKADAGWLGKLTKTVDQQVRLDKEGPVVLNDKPTPTNMSQREKQYYGDT